jgi:hypothetical protein
LFAFEWRSRGLQADGLDEFVEVIDDALVEAVELRTVLASSFVSALTGERRPAVSGP